MSRKKRERKERRLQEKYLAEVQHSQNTLTKRALRTGKSAGGKDSILLQNPQGIKKMSEVLLEFADPYLNHAQDFEDSKKVLTMAGLAWNLSIMDSPEMVKKFEDISSDFQSNFYELVQLMIKRKKTHYGAIKRLILDMDYIQTSHGPHLNVVSTVIGGSDEQETVERLLERTASP